MLIEAELYVLAERAWGEVIRQVRDDQWELSLPPPFDMPGLAPTSLREAVNHVCYDSGWIPDMLAGSTMDEVGRERYDSDLAGPALVRRVTDTGTAGVAAAEQASDREKLVRCSYGDVETWHYFWQIILAAPSPGTTSRCWSARTVRCPRSWPAVPTREPSRTPRHGVPSGSSEKPCRYPTTPPGTTGSSG